MTVLSFKDSSRTAASLRLVSPGAVTGGVTFFTSKSDYLFSHRIVIKTDDLFYVIVTTPALSAFPRDRLSIVFLQIQLQTKYFDGVAHLFYDSLLCCCRCTDCASGHSERLLVHSVAIGYTQLHHFLTGALSPTLCDEMVTGQTLDQEVMDSTAGHSTVN